MKSIVILPDVQVEEWRSIPSYPDYEVSNMGRVRSWRQYGPLRNRRSEPRVMAGSVDQDGYIRYAVGGGGGKIRGGHQLVLEVFNPDGRFDDAIVAHNNGNPSDNRLENLRWATPAENSGDRGRHGTLGLRLSTEDCFEIKRLYEMGFKQREIARVFRTQQSHVHNIVAGKVRSDAQ